MKVKVLMPKPAQIVGMFGVMPKVSGMWTIRMSPPNSRDQAIPISRLRIRDSAPVQ